MKLIEKRNGVFVMLDMQSVQHLVNGIISGGVFSVVVLAIYFTAEYRSRREQKNH